MKKIEIERDCTRCPDGVVLHSFVLCVPEPDVGIMAGHAEYDYSTACTDCGTVPTPYGDEIENLEYDALEEASWR